jgi:uncharacterized protein YndB with AHSA1/START domain
MSHKVDVTTPTELDIRITRAFDAPPELVFDAHTKPDLLKKWMLGPPGWSMGACEIDLRVGGRYRVLWRSDENGDEFNVRGQYRDIERPARLINTETFDGVAGETLCAALFAPSGDGTFMTLTMSYESQELRDGALQSGMADGMAECFDRLDDVAQTASA